MPRREKTSQEIFAEMDAEGKRDETKRVQISMPWVQFHKLVKLAESQHMSTSAFVRKAIDEYERKLKQDDMIPATQPVDLLYKIRDDLRAEMDAIKSEVMEQGKTALDNEGTSLSPDEEEAIWGSMRAMLAHGPATTRDLATVARAPWQVISKIATMRVDDHLLERHGSKWRLPA